MAHHKSKLELWGLKFFSCQMNPGYFRVTMHCWRIRLRITWFHGYLQSDNVSYNTAHVVAEWLQENESKLLLLQWPTQSPDLNSKTEVPHATRYLMIRQHSGIEKAFKTCLFKEGPQKLVTQLIYIRWQCHFSQLLDVIIHFHTTEKHKHLKHSHSAAWTPGASACGRGNLKTISSQWKVKHSSTKWNLLCIWYAGAIFLYIFLLAAKFIDQSSS